MNTQIWTWIGWGVSIFCLPVIAWIFSNPKELGVKETRSLAAKPWARWTFWWTFLGLIANLSFSYLKLATPFSTDEVKTGFAWLLPIVTICVLVAYWVTLMRTHPAIAESASDEMIRDWRRKRPTRTEFAMILGFIILSFICRLVQEASSH